MNFQWENSGEIFGEDFSTCLESTKNFGANFGANFGENFGNFVSNFATFFSETSFSRRAVPIDTSPFRGFQYCWLVRKEIPLLTCSVSACGLMSSHPHSSIIVKASASNPSHFACTSSRESNTGSLEAQQRYFSYRAILVVIVSQNSFVLVFMGYRTIIARYVANGVSHRCSCVKLSTKGGVSHHFGGLLT